MGDWKIMALASCEDNYPMVRNVSCLFIMIKSILRQIRTLERHSSCLKIIVLQCVLMEHKLEELLLIKDWSLMNQEEFLKKEI